MTDADVMQEFFDTYVVTKKLGSIVDVHSFLAGRHGLLEYAPNASSDPRHVLSCIRKIYEGIGYRLFRPFAEMEHTAPSEGLDDIWAGWCPCPNGCELSKASYPAGAIPLWTNGTSTVFCRVGKDDRGYERMDFAVC